MLGGKKEKRGGKGVRGGTTLFPACIWTFSPFVGPHIFIQGKRKGRRGAVGGTRQHFCVGVCGTNLEPPVFVPSLLFRKREGGGRRNGAFPIHALSQGFIFESWLLRKKKRRRGGRGKRASGFWLDCCNCTPSRCARYSCHDQQEKKEEKKKGKSMMHTSPPFLRRR